MDSLRASLTPSRFAHACMVAGAVFACVAAAGIYYGPSPVTGDETEYYATTYAWAANGSPALTPAIVGAVREAFPGRPATEPAVARAVDGSYYGIHFWFLSLMAAPFFGLCRAIGLDWKHCFAFLDALAFAGAAGLAYRWFRLLGAAIVMAGLLVSPLAPYLNKAHGEAWSVSLAAVAAIWLITDYWLAAALALAAVAAQVSAFAPLALAALGKWGFDRWRARQRPEAREWAAVGACLALVALQPLWTIWRYHELNVIVAEGFVYPEMATPRRMLSILIDPDVGLAFVWPLSLLPAAWIAAGGWRRSRAYWIFAAALMAEVCYVGAQQMNLTTSAPRYSLWFIPFLLVGFVAAIGKSRRRMVAAGASFALGAAAMGYYQFAVAGVAPRLERKPVAEWWYRHLPGVWDPEEQVYVDLGMREQLVSGRDFFFKRRFPITKLVDRQVWAVGNRGCTKLLVFGWAFTSSGVAPTAPAGCEGPVDGARLLRYVRGLGGAGMEDRFVSVPAGERGKLRSNDLVSDLLSWPSAAKTNGAGFVFEFSDPSGWQYLDHATIMISPRGGEPKPEQSCYVIYDQPRHELSVMRENGTIALGVVPGRKGELRSRWCALDTARASIAAGGNTLTVKLALTLDPAIDSGGIDVRTAAVDLDGNSSAPGAAPEFRFDPAAAAQFAYSYGGAHTRDVARFWVLMHDKLSEENACYFEYEPAAGVLRLMPDDADGAKAMEMRLAEGRRVENGHCAVDGRGSGAAANRDGGVLRLPIEGKGLFAASKRVWLRYQESDGALSNWQEMAPWLGREVPDGAPSVMLRPETRGDVLHVQFQYGGSGLKDVARVWLLVNDRLEAEGSCYLTYEPGTGTAYLNEAGEHGGAGAMPLKDGTQLGNSRCELDVGESEATVAGSSLDLRWRVRRREAFRGAKRVWAADQKTDGRATEWSLVGVWR